MLYDNAQLARVYLHAWQVTGNEFFRTITEEILDYVVREMTDPAGVQMLHAQHLPSSSSSAGTAGFYSTQDADSEGEEGKFFVWTPDEMRQVLGSEADAFMAAYGVTERGNFEGKNILEFVGDLDQRPALVEARHKLFKAPEKRVHPGRDEEVLTSWNGLMLAAFAEAARVMDRDDYREVAETMIAHFQAPGGGFFDTSEDHETLITRPRDLQDNATPSGNAMAVTALLKLAGFTNDLHYVDIAHQALPQMQTPTGGDMMSQYPLGFGQWLQALAYALSKPREIAIVGDADSADTQALLSVVRDRYQPFQVVAMGAPDAQPASVPLLQDRGLVVGRATAYVCRSFSCRTPATDVDALRVLLENG